MATQTWISNLRMEEILVCLRTCNVPRTEADTIQDLKQKLYVIIAQNGITDVQFFVLPYAQHWNQRTGK